MLLTLIGKNSINRLTLPNEIMGNYWLCDKNSNSKLINIKSFEDKWQIESTYRCKIINEKNVIFNNNKVSIYKSGKEILENITLKEYSFYYINIGEKDDIYVLYCSPVYEDNYIHLHMKNTSSILIGRDKENNDIIYDNKLISNIQAKIFFLNGIWWIKNNDKKFNTFINDKPISDTTKMISNGDRITIYGLTIIIINKEIFINNPQHTVDFNKNNFVVSDYQNNRLIKKEDEEDFNKYINNDYFFRTPRMVDSIEKQEVKIASPQLSQKNKELPLALVFGSSLSMVAMMSITLVQSIDNYVSGQSNIKSLIFSLLMSGTMLLTAVLIPVLNRKYKKKMDKQTEEESIEKYEKYIDNKKRAIEKILKEERSILYKTYITAEECIEIILRNPKRLWERKRVDNDFLTVRLGVGDIASEIELEYSIEENADVENESYKLMFDCIEMARTLKDAPVLFSIEEKNISAILYKKEELKYRYIQNLVLQLITFQSYDELKIVFLLKDNVNEKWNFAKMLPHVWSNSRDMRFFADDSNGINEVAQYLESELKKRVRESSEKTNYKTIMPYYLIIVDDYKNIENLNIINEILKSEQNMGFSILFITNSILKLPNECKTFINIDDSRGELYESENVDKSKVNFRISTSETFFFDKINTVLSEILIKYTEEKELQLPSSYTFLEMYNVGCIEQLNIYERWKKNDSTISLSAPIGIDGEGKQIALDIHEKFHGPHGLVAGSTGSGKSEFIITYILSLAVNYHPDDVTFVLIDYKGGGLAGAFQRPDMQLPHVVGTITNIDKGSLQRSLESIESELKRRQIKFNEAKFATGESTIDIYKYQRYYHNGILKDPISHLFIICDEFAELKQQEPDFMDEIISVARIGRSLGVHLILATQKPSGVVNDQIRSNVKFGVCLKVQSTADSQDVIGMPDAAKLKGAGQFYFKVGNDDYLALGQSAWAGALYHPSDEVKKEYDNSIEFISSTGRILKKVDNDKKGDKKNYGEQLTNLVKFISDLAERENIKEEKLWLDAIPETIYLKDIRKKYHVKSDENVIKPVIGEYDDPSKQLQNVMTLDLTSGGNVAIYGNAESGKETLISTMIYDIMTNYSSEIAQMYILDFGSETMRIFKKVPHVGDVILPNDSEKIIRLFMMLRKELKDRKQILSEYNGDYNLYVKLTNKVIPEFIVILNNYESFIENYGDSYDEILEVLLREGIKYRIVFIFVLGTPTGLRYRIAQNFRQKIALQMNKDSDYSSIFDYVRQKRPSQMFGRGLVNIEEKKYFEFQTAKICEPEAWNEQVLNEIEKQNQIQKVKATEIPIVPEIVTINHLEQYLTDLSAFPIGIANKNITPCLIDLTKNLITVMITNDIEEHAKFILNIIEELKIVPNTDLLILDAENITQTNENDLKNEYLIFFGKANQAKKLKNTICIIIGLDKFIGKLGDDDFFYASLQNAQQLKKINYIIIDSLSRLNNHTYSDWYKKCVPNDTGVWLGNGVNEQYLLKSGSSAYKMSNTCGYSYGYVFKKGKPVLTKLLGMKEKGEEDE